MQVITGGLNALHYPAVMASGKKSLLFVHGQWGGAWQFQYKKWLTTAAEMGHDVYAINLRKDDGISIHDHCSDVFRVIESMDSTPIVIGHSMGALIAQIVAVRRKLPGVVLISPPVPLLKMDAMFIFKMMRYIGALTIGKNFLLTRKDMMQFLLNMVTIDDSIEIMNKLVPDSGRVARDVALGSVKVGNSLGCPTLVIVGRKDRLFPCAWQVDVAEKLRACYLEFDNGHMVMLEKSDNVIREILSWIELG